jgi:FtsH-binding integral membrane protein
MDYEAQVVSSVVVRFFNAVYGWMAAGLALTAVVAWYVASHPEAMRLIFGPQIWILFIAELALVFTISAAINKISAPVATALFMLYAGLNGLTLSIIFLIYTKSSLASAFGVTAGTFAAMSLYGMVTKTDLTRIGSFLFMALIGLVIASVVNLFWANSTMQWIITYAGVFIFVGLTAYDTQKLKQIAYATQNDPAMAARLSVNGALTLYLDFINLFLFILRLMGDRRS